MNKIGLALRELYRAEEELADEYVKAGERLAAEHELWYDCRRFAQQCHAHADAIRPFWAAGLGYQERLGSQGVELHDPHGRGPVLWFQLMDPPRTGRGRFQAQEVSFHWIVAGQLAQATRDHELLELVDELHRETLTQVKWLKTQVKQASPQALVVGADS